MKRAGHLIEPIAELDNLHEAFLRAARGKRDKLATRQFSENLSENLQRLRQIILCGNPISGEYHFFTIHDPKKRVICAASFEQRVLFHAIMRVCHKIFDDSQVYDSYASRKSKGQYKALERAMLFCNRYRWFAKLDMQKYFDSIDHEVMKSQLSRLIKDPRLLRCFDCLIHSYEVSPGKGLPIGNLTSQYFANHYLVVADRYSKETLKIPGLVRYMDDVLFFGNDKVELKKQIAEYRAFVEQNLKLCIHPTVLNSTQRGIPFLGYVVFPKFLRLNSHSLRRLKRKMASISVLHSQDVITDREYAARATALLAFATKANCDNVLAQMSRFPGMYPSGL